MSVVNQETFERFLSGIGSYTSSLIDVGYGNKEDHAIRVVLVSSSLFLSIASGYTTFNGLDQYLPDSAFYIITLLVTFGIQGLLFGISWRLGKLYVVGDLNPFMWSIWLITMLVSVFFSFSSLFETVYSDDERTTNRGIDSVTVSTKILRKLGQNITDDIKAGKKNIEPSLYKDWKFDFSSVMEKSRKTIEQTSENHEKKYRSLLDKYDDEINFGGTEYKNKSGLIVKSKPGPGEISEEIKAEYESFYKKTLIPYQAKSEKILRLIDNAGTDLLEYEKKTDINQLNAANEKCLEIINFSRLVATCNSAKLGDSFSDLLTLEEAYRNYLSFCSPAALGTTLEKNMLLLTTCIPRHARNDAQADFLLNQVQEFQKKNGSHSHFITTVIGELSSFNYLAISSLILALIIDVLILLCSLVASRHSTFLNIRDSKDLHQMESYPLDTVISVDTVSKESDSQIVRRVKEILNSSKFDLKSAREGFSMVISMSEIERLKMHKELGTFLSMDLAVPDEDWEKIRFRTRFVLWMCEQIIKDKQSTKTYSDLDGILRKEAKI